jgi:hypothetical protein
MSEIYSEWNNSNTLPQYKQNKTKQTNKQTKTKPPTNQPRPKKTKDSYLKQTFNIFSPKITNDRDISLYELK